MNADNFQRSDIKKDIISKPLNGVSSRTRRKFSDHFERLKDLEAIGAILSEEEVHGSSPHLKHNLNDFCLDLPTTTLPSRSSTSSGSHRDLFSSSSFQLNSCNLSAITKSTIFTDSVLSVLNAQEELDSILIAARQGNNVALASVLQTGTRSDDEQFVETTRHPDDARSTDNSTALHIAASEGHKSTVILLLRAGADVHFLNKNLESPLFLACYQGHTDVVKELVNFGANVNGANEFGETPIFYAARRGYADVVRFLLENGAEYLVCNRFGETAEEEATDEGVIAEFRNVLERSQLL